MSYELSRYQDKPLFIEHFSGITEDVTKTGNGERETGVWGRVYSGNPYKNSK